MNHRYGWLWAIVLGLVLTSAARANDPVELTEEARVAVGRALEYLKKNQHTDGSWRADVGYKLNYNYRVTERFEPHIGVTSLACMAFMAGGNLPGRGRYGAQVKRGLNYVLKHVRDGGFVTHHGSRMYSHAFATLFLAEVYGMTHNPKVRKALKAAVKLIIDSQNDQGGWRYAPGAQDSDMSIVVCQVQALRAARMVGISVPIHVIEKARRYVKRSAQPNGSFKYQDLVVSRDSFALTAAGVTALHGTAIYNDARVKRGLEYLMTRRHLSYGTYFYYYGHYYAVQAMYISGGKWPRFWRNWYPWIRNDLTSRQNRDGSWENRVGPGESFATAMGALILQIPYRYLPIFQR